MGPPWLPTFVRKTGSNAANGTSAGTAWQTLGKVLASGSTVVVGDVVNVGGGRYNETVVGAAGTVSTKSITAASNASPIQITVTGHGYSTGQYVHIWGVLGNQNANGVWKITVVDANNFTLTGSTGSGAYTSAGTVSLVIAVLADLDGSQTGDAGDVVFTSHASDAAAAAAVTTLTLNGQSGLYFQGMTFYGGTTATVALSTATYVSFRQCAFYHNANNPGIVCTSPTANVALHHLVDGCVMMIGIGGGSSAGLGYTLTDPGVATQLDLDVLVINSLFLGAGTGLGVKVTPPATSTGNCGGVRVHNCTLVGLNVCFQLLTNATGSTSIPCEAYNCFMSGSTCLSVVTTAGQMLENFNRLIGNTIRSVVAAGANSVTGSQAATALDIGQSWLYPGRQPRPFLSPLAGSPVLGFGGSTVYVQPATDMMGRARPAGAGVASAQANVTGTATGAQTTTTLQDTGTTFTGIPLGFTVAITGGTGAGQQRPITTVAAHILTVNPAWTTTPVAASSTYKVYNPGSDIAAGAFERHDQAAAGGAANADGAAGDCWSQVGPSDDEVEVAVDAASTTISFKQKTASYVGTNYPQIELVANALIGVTAQTVTDSAANTSYTTLTLAAFTPTAKGVVKLRLKNRTTDGAGTVYWDTAGIV